MISATNCQDIVRPQLKSLLATALSISPRWMTISSGKVQNLQNSPDCYLHPDHSTLHHQPARKHLAPMIGFGEFPGQGLGFLWYFWEIEGTNSYGLELTQYANIM